MSERLVAVRKSAWLAGLVNHPGRFALLIAVATFAIGALVSSFRWPLPSVHDEFSYLLAADTFCEGRLTNPTHPHWQHFETIHVVHQPSYASKYPPGQGLLLGLGQWLAGAPITGVWIASALATAACYWMLLGWVPRRWAAAGGVLLVVHPGFQLQWGQSYWGGTVAFLGGALVFGALPRILRSNRPSAIDATAMALGAVVLGVARPYEGLVVCLIAGGLLVRGWWQRGLPAWRVLLASVALPQVLVLAVGGAALACYHQAVTGNPFKFPYSVHEATYALSPNFLWQSAVDDRDYRHEVMSRFHHEWAMDWYRRQQTLPGIVRTKTIMTTLAVQFFFPLPLALPLVLVPQWRGRKIRLVGAVVAVSWLASMITIWSWPHYMAPMAPLLLLVAIWGLRNLNVLGRRWWGCGHLAVGVIALQVVLFAGNVVARVARPCEGFADQRATVITELKSQPGNHLVFVRYDDDHNTHSEWVYNRADIDGARIVWAREMGHDRDAALCQYFADRQVWLLEADANPPRLLPHDPAAGRR